MKKRGESGFAMLLVFLMAAAIAITLYLELPRAAFQAQRQKEQLLIERGEQYKRAIQLFVRANNRYPGDLKDLENFNNRRFLRHKFIDPMTGKDDWRIVHINNGVLTDSVLNKQKPGDTNQQAASTAGQYVGEQAGLGTTLTPAQQIANSAVTRRRVSEGGVNPGGGPDGQAGAPGQPITGIAPIPGRQFPGQPLPGQAFPGQPLPGQPFPGQPFPGQAFPGQAFPGQAFPGQVVPSQPALGQPSPQQFQGQVQAQPFPGGQTPGGFQAQPVPGVPTFPGQAGGQPYPGVQTYPGQVQTQPFPGQIQPQPFSGTPPNPGTPIPPEFANPGGGLNPTGQPISGQPIPGQPTPGQPIPGRLPAFTPSGVQSNQNPPGQPYVGGTQPYVGGSQPYVGGGAYIGSQPTPTPGVGNPAPFNPGQVNSQPVPTQPNLPGVPGIPPTPGAVPMPGAPQTPGAAQIPNAGFPGAPGQSPAADMINNILRNPRPTQPNQQPAGQQMGGGIAGVASKSEESAIMVYNDHTNYNEWEFIFDYTKQTPLPNMNGGTIGRTAASLGSLPGGASAVATANPTTAIGASPGATVTAGPLGQATPGQATGGQATPGRGPGQTGGAPQLPPGLRMGRR